MREPKRDDRPPDRSEGTEEIVEVDGQTDELKTRAVRTKALKPQIAIRDSIVAGFSPTWRPTLPLTSPAMMVAMIPSCQCA